ncbi:hypothetical protein V6N12_055859 [Hibiscus sabdariffa]|uniref:Uncharacterized protein n=1 Tax=Hibiscus sabdariffa TaxID=183260 RepID=A0ABR2CQT9_9ROSI
MVYRAIGFKVQVLCVNLSRGDWIIYDCVGLFLGSQSVWFLKDFLFIGSGGVFGNSLYCSPYFKITCTGFFQFNW